MVAFIQYLFLKGFGFFVNLLPEGFALSLGRTMGKVGYFLDWEHRKVALENLHVAFGQEKIGGGDPVDCQEDLSESGHDER